MHVVGDILTKISVNFVINLHVALSFTCLLLWIYLMSGYKCIYIYGYCLYMLHVYVYYYFSMNPCIYKMYLFAYVLYIMFHKSSVCICFNCMQFEKFMWHSSVGYWVCYNMVSDNKSVLWSSMPWYGWLGMLQTPNSYFFLLIKYLFVILSSSFWKLFYGSNFIMNWIFPFVTSNQPSITHVLSHQNKMNRLYVS
jgi:hypothetical protein